MKHIFLVLEYGHVTRARDESGRPGRPRQLFTLTAPAEPSGAEQRNYRLLATILAATTPTQPPLEQVGARERQLRQVAYIQHEVEATGITLPPVDDTKAIDLQPTEKIGYLALTQERVRAENRVTGSDQHLSACQPSPVTSPTSLARSPPVALVRRPRVKVELQADCYADVWINHAATVPTSSGRQLTEDVTAQGITGGLAAVALIDDDVISITTDNRSGSTSVQGTSAQRQEWLSQDGRPVTGRAATRSHAE